MHAIFRALPGPTYEYTVIVVGVLLYEYRMYVKSRSARTTVGTINNCSRTVAL